MINSVCRRKPTKIPFPTNGFKAKGKDVELKNYSVMFWLKNDRQCLWPKNQQKIPFFTNIFKAKGKDVELEQYFLIFGWKMIDSVCCQKPTKNSCFYKYFQDQRKRRDCAAIWVVPTNLKPLKRSVRCHAVKHEWPLVGWSPIMFPHNSKMSFPLQSGCYFIHRPVPTRGLESCRYTPPPRGHKSDSGHFTDATHATRSRNRDICSHSVLLSRSGFPIWTSILRYYSSAAACTANSRHDHFHRDSSPCLR